MTNELWHWHPVLTSDSLSRAPRAIELCGVHLVLFRTKSGQAHALLDRCPHRNMRLSAGWVEGERLVCPYHGWSYDALGAGISPSTPNARPCVISFETTEAHGSVWVRARGSTALLPGLSFPGYEHIYTMRSVIRAPLELVLDNQNEIEHTATTHWLVGYPREALSTLEVSVSSTDESISVENKGPQKALPVWLAPLLSIREGDQYITRWTLRFSPLYQVSSSVWLDPITQKPRDHQTLNVMFYNPINQQQTELVTMFYVASARRLPIVHRAMMLVAAQLFRLELYQDQKMLEGLATKQVDLRGNTLGRLDQALPAIRQRVRRVYRREQ